MDKMLRACLNWKVIGGLTVVGLGLWLVAPNLLAAALPVLLLAVCPLSMMLMMRSMGERGSDQESADHQKTSVAPPTETERAKLEAMKEEIDQRIRALESADQQPSASEPATEKGKQRI